MRVALKCSANKLAPRERRRQRDPTNRSQRAKLVLNIIGHIGLT